MSQAQSNGHQSGVDNTGLLVKKPRAKRTAKVAASKAAPKAKAAPFVLVDTSGLIPTEYNVIIKQREVEEKIGSVYIPQVARDKEQWAEVEGMLISVSPLAFGFDRWPEGARKPTPGDNIIIAKYSGNRVKGNDGLTYLVTKDKDISIIRAAT